MIGEDVHEALECDLKLERRAHPDLKEAIAHCETSATTLSRELFEDILESEEEHIDFLETQLDADRRSRPAELPAVADEGRVLSRRFLTALQRRGFGRQRFAAAARLPRPQRHDREPGSDQRDAGPFGSPKRSSKIAIDESSAITGMANMLSERFPRAGSAARRSTAGIPSPSTRHRSTRAAPRRRRSMRVAGSVIAKGSTVSGSTPTHLPCDEVQEVEVMPPLVILGRDCPGRPPEARQHRPQLRRQVARPVPRRDDQHESRERERDRRPLAAADAFVQHRPGNEQRPERHREDQH